MKKAVVILLVFALVLGMTGAAFAGGRNNHSSDNKAGIKLKLAVNAARVDQKTAVVNLVAAKSGDAYAVGNVGITCIKSETETKCCDGKDEGTATTTNSIVVTNTGTATATSAPATATNTSNNTVSNSVSFANN